MKVFWIIIISLYGVISLYFGLKLNSLKLLDRINNSAKNSNERYTVFSILRYGFTLIFSIAGLILFIPAGIIGLSKDIIDSYRIDKEIERKRKSGYLYHEYMGGTGLIVCKDCEHKENIVSFLHGHMDPRWSRTGYQCPECGKHQVVFRYEHEKPDLTCECGGTLKRNDPLFCPVCRRKNVKYKSTVIT